LPTQPRIMVSGVLYLPKQEILFFFFFFFFCLVSEILRFDLYFVFVLGWIVMIHS